MQPCAIARLESLSLIAAAAALCCRTARSTPLPTARVQRLAPFSDRRMPLLPLHLLFSPSLFSLSFPRLPFLPACLSRALQRPPSTSAVGTVSPARHLALSLSLSRSLSRSRSPMSSLTTNSACPPSPSCAASAARCFLTCATLPAARCPRPSFVPLAHTLSSFPIGYKEGGIGGVGVKQLAKKHVLAGFAADTLLCPNAAAASARPSTPS